MEQSVRKTARKNSALMTSQLIGKLVDENLMQRYGTSLEVNMGREYQKYLDKKYQELKYEFEKVNKSSDEFISIEELTDFINTFSHETGKTYDEEYVRQLFNIIDIDEDEKLTLQEFILAYMTLEEKLRLKKIRLQKLDDELRGLSEKYFKGMNENRGEVMTAEGIAKGTTLYVKLLEAKDLKPMDFDGTSDPYVIFELGGKKLISSYKEETLDPVWNEEFSYPVTNPNMELSVEVWSRDAYAKHDLEGEVTISLKDLADQKKADKWYEISNGEEKTGYLRLGLHYIHSRYKYFTDLYNNTNEQIVSLQNDITELNRYYELFEKPFGIVLYGEVHSIVDKKILDRGEDVSTYMITNRKSLFVSPRFSMIKSGFAHKMESVIRGTLKRTNIEWSKLVLVMMYSMMVCSALCLIERPDFVNLFLGVAVWILFIREKKLNALEYLRYLLYALFITIFYDFIWLYIHYQSYWVGSTYERPMWFLKSFSYFFSFWSFIAKIILLVSLWLQFNKNSIMEKNEKNKLDQSMNKSYIKNSIINIGNSYYKS